MGCTGRLRIHESRSDVSVVTNKSLSQIKEVKKQRSRKNFKQGGVRRGGRINWQYKGRLRAGARPCRDLVPNCVAGSQGGRTWKGWAKPRRHSLLFR